MDQTDQMTSRGIARIVDSTLILCFIIFFITHDALPTFGKCSLGHRDQGLHTPVPFATKHADWVEITQDYHRVLDMKSSAHVLVQSMSSRE